MKSYARIHNLCFEEPHVFLLRALEHGTASARLAPTLPLATLPPLLPPKKIFLTSLKFQMLTHSLDLAWDVRDLLTLSPLLFFLPLSPSSLSHLLFPPSPVNRFTYHTHSHRLCRVRRAHPNHPVAACSGPSLASLLFLLFSLPQATHLRVHEQVRQIYPPPPTHTSLASLSLPSPLHSSSLQGGAGVL